MSERAYKVLTHDLRSPIQGGDPIFDGKLPFELPTVEVDESSAECAAGWNACREPHIALQIAGLWPDGWPSRLFVVSTDGPVIERGDKVRAATWTVVEEIADVTPHVETLTREVFRAGDLTAGLAREQMLWREALSRPLRNERWVEDGLRLALERWGLPWRLRRFDTAYAAYAARRAGHAWAAWAAWGARDARHAGAAYAARHAWAAWAAWGASAARDARHAWAAWAARAARHACMVWYASEGGLGDYPANMLSVGLRTAYRHGLAVALPTGPDELGWAMLGDADSGTEGGEDE